MAASRTTRCPGCGASGGEPFFEVEQVPVYCNVVAPTAEAARAMPRGDIRLAFCGACGTIWNAAFEPERLSYDASYENSLHFSPRFAQYAEDLAARLLAEHGRDGLRIVEIGCGKGDFLALLARDPRVRCVGFDASYDDHQAAGGLHIVKSFYDAGHAAEYPADLLVCRHVLEHIPHPRPFLDGLVAALPDDGQVYFEVPDTTFTLRDHGVWDVIYEHCTYFTAPSIATLFAAHGLHPRAVQSQFGGQFLCVDAGRRAGPPPALAVDVAEVAGHVAEFAGEFERVRARWTDELDQRLSRGQRIAVWGAGSKGMTFVNVVPRGSEIQAVVDINERKWHQHAPGTGQPIVGPQELAARGVVDVVLVMNPNYRDEIAGQLAGLGVTAEVLVVR